MESAKSSENDVCESPNHVRTSLAAAMTMGLIPGSFYRGAKLYCLNLLLTYQDGCMAGCAYCGLSRARSTEGPWSDHSFIRVDWPVVSVDEVARRIDDGFCSHVERICVSMITHRRAREDTLSIVTRLHGKAEGLSTLITPTIIDQDWLHELKEAGADMVGIAVDASTPELFDKWRGRGVRGPHRWQKYWRTLGDAVEIFGRHKAGIHLIVGLGETEEDMARTIQRAYDIGALTHLFSFYPEDGSLMQSRPQPPVGKYRRIQLARYLIEKQMSNVSSMKFDGEGRIVDFGIDMDRIESVTASGKPFMTSGCGSSNREGACNRPFSNCTPYQAYVGELRNYPFQPDEEDTQIIRRQLSDYSDLPTKTWINGPGSEEL